MKKEFKLSDKEVVDDDAEMVYYKKEDVKKFVELLKEELESDKYRDDEYPAHQSFIRKELGLDLDYVRDSNISYIIDKLAGDLK